MPVRSTPPPTYPFGHLSMPVQSVETLPNGLTMHYFRGGDQPICSLSVVFPGGAAEHDESAGRMAVNLLTEGTANHTADQLAEIIDFNGAKLGGVHMRHHTDIRLVALEHRIKDMLPIMAEIIAEPAFDAKRLHVAKIKAVNEIQTLRMDVSALASDESNRLIYGNGHPLAHIAQPQDIERLTPETLAALHKGIINPAGAHAFLSGYFTDDILDSVRSMLAAIPALSEGTELNLCPGTPANGGTIVKIPFESSLQSAISMSIPSIPRCHPDYIPLRMAVTALGGYFGSRLMTNIREEKGLTYGIRAMLCGSLEGSYVGIMARCDKSYAYKVTDEIKKELLLLASQPPQGEELERLKTHLASELADNLDSASKVMQYYRNIVTFGTPADYFEQQQTHLDAITSTSIAEMADKYLKPEMLLTAIAGAPDIQ